MARRGKIRVGVSGWTYSPWRGAFFPRGLPQRDELAFAARHFSSIEINGTFYRLQRPESFARWAQAVPPGFVFAVKGSRYISHMLRAGAIDTALANFFASGLLRLGPALGPLLWQFPARFHFDAARMEHFLTRLPRDSEAAAELARHHDSRLAGHAWTETDARRPLRHAVEIRHESFAVPAFIDLLRAHGVALVCADTVDWPRLMDVTADFIYCRLHGSQELYRSGYDRTALRAWADRARLWAAGRTPGDGRLAGQRRAPVRRRDVFVYFDNTDKMRAPGDAQALMRRLADATG